MMIFWIILGSILVFLLILFIVLGIIGYHMIYKRTKEKYCVLKVPNEKFRFPLSVKERYREYIQIPCEKVEILSKRNNHLYGELRRCPLQNSNETKTIILFSHGFQSSGDNDICLFDYFQLKKYDILVIDHEGCGNSEGRCCGFGVYEQENIQLWVEKVNEMYDHKVNIFLHGVSMGSNSVLLCADKKMENVKGIIGDCGYISTFSILRYLTKLSIVAFFVCVFNSFVLRRNILSYSTKKTLGNSLYPILLFHGEEDTFVPFFMSERNNRYCSTEHKFIPIKKATHAMSYQTDKVQYEKEFDGFIDAILNNV
jgi:uncharacterized protein